jgi:molybdenum cofactor sulfurtransferase
LLGQSFPWSGDKMHTTHSIVAVGDDVAQDGTSVFCYFHDSHTSVVGIRELAMQHGARITCFHEHDVSVRSVESVIDCGSQIDNQEECHHLIAYPAQCNFSGRKYPLEWITHIRDGRMILNGRQIGPNWHVLLDAAAFVSTSPLDLSLYSADFVTISFYKIFGFPTGLGALLVRNDCRDLLKKTYFGGGTVQAIISGENFRVFQSDLSSRFEDGTLPFLDIIALQHGFDVLCHLTGSIVSVSLHTLSLARYVYEEMVSLCHGNGQSVCQVYSETDYKDVNTQGPVISFNVLEPDGSYVGYSQVGKLAVLFDIHMRTGCFCNSGACQRYLGLSAEQLKQNLKAGHVCGDDVDLVNGLPTGCVRVSFGYMSTFEEADYFLQFIKHCFVQPRTVLKMSPIPQYTCTTMTTETLAKSEVSTDSHCFKACGSCSYDTNEVYSIECADSPKRKDVVQEIGSTESFSWLKKIFVYPVKSCGAFEVTEWNVGSKGLLYDREWMVVSDSGSCVTQKQASMMCLILPEVCLSTGMLILRAEGQSPLEVPLEVNMEYSDMKATTCRGKVCGDSVEGFDCGDAAATWFSQVLERPCRLMRQMLTSERLSKFASKEKLSLVNQSQFLLVTEPSLMSLAVQIGNKECRSTIEGVTQRFRPNLVVSGPFNKFAEDSWKSVRLGPCQFQVSGLCTRCQMISIDQATGNRSNDLLKCLVSLRGRKVTFGIYLVAANPINDKGEPNYKILQRGDPVVISCTDSYDD